jgi:hypothetical protein
MALADLLLRGAGALGQRLAATQQPQAPTTPNPLQTAFTNALVNPNMPIEAGFQTPSAKVNADLERQARIQNQLAAGRAAIIERARAQGRSVSTDPATGQLVIGDAPASSPVQTVGGQRFAFDQQGRVVGMAADTGVAPPRVQGQTTPSVLTPEMADMSRQRIAAALGEALRRSAAPVAAAAPAMAAPVAAAAPAMAAPAVAAAPAPTMAAPAAPALPLPTAPARPTPMPSAPFRDATGRVDTAAVARAQGRTPVETTPPPVTPEQVDAALAEAETMQEIQAIGQAEQQATQATRAFDRQIADLTNRLTAASRAGNRAEVIRLTNSIRRLRAQRAGQLSSAPIIEAGSPMF